MPSCPPQHTAIFSWFEDWQIGREFPALANISADSPPRKIEAFALWSGTYEAVKFQIALKKL